jgi:hypothetical protein
VKTIRVKVKPHVQIIGGLLGTVASCDARGDCKLRLWSEDGRYIGIWDCNVNDLNVLMKT